MFLNTVIKSEGSGASMPGSDPALPLLNVRT